MAGVVCDSDRPGGLKLIAAAIPPKYADGGDAELRCPEDVVLAVADHSGVLRGQLDPPGAKGVKSVGDDLRLGVALAIETRPTDEREVAGEVEVFKDSGGRDGWLRGARRHRDACVGELLE